jgi:hypothetical protein
MTNLESLLNEYNTTIGGVEAGKHERFNIYANVHHSNAI